VTAAFLGDVFAVRPWCCGFCTFVRFCSIWSLIILSNIYDDAWIVIRMLQTEATTIVKWKGKFSTGFFTQQGIRQGAKLSLTLFKSYNNQLLDILRDNNIGAKIGTTLVPSGLIGYNM
jgi:hypothetical protein